jgi:DNA polymerase I
VKSRSGEELNLDDAPARKSDLFLVDGNNLAYRGFFALPPEIQTSTGVPTNALLGFAGMLFKLITDYRPRGVAVAWDSRPVTRIDAAPDYKANRNPMPDRLRAQFPHFRPLVEAFGYRNLAFEGWEADDVIATMATRAEQAGISTCIVSTDRDAFQLVSSCVCLMMTPRGVSDPQVYTPARIHARYGIGPEAIPDFIALKGDSADNIPSIPGFGEKTAAELLARYGSLDDLIAHAGELTPSKKKAILEHAAVARSQKNLATLRRDLDIDFDPRGLVLGGPDRSKLRDMFERFEFKKMISRLHLLEA